MERSPTIRRNDSSFQLLLRLEEAGPEWRDVDTSPSKRGWAGRWDMTERLLRLGVRSRALSGDHEGP